MPHYPTMDRNTYSCVNESHSLHFRHYMYMYIHSNQVPILKARPWTMDQRAKQNAEAKCYGWCIIIHGP